MKPTLLAIALLAAMVGLTACAKYPVILRTPGPPPTAATPAYPR